jgi:hypothetical protein
MLKERMALFEEICKDIDLASDRQQKVARLQEAAKILGVDLTSRNYHHCYDLVIEYSHPALEQVKTMINREIDDRKFFIDLLLDPWCKRHNLTREQALSIICDDGSYNKNAPEKQMITKEDLFCGAAMNTWYHMFFNKCYTDQSIEKGGLN